MARTVATVHTPAQRKAQRCRAEMSLRMMLYRWFALASLLRSTVVIVSGEGGAAGWWLTALCLLPGLAACGLLHTALRFSGCATVPALAQQLAGRGGRIAVQWLAALLMTVEGLNAMQALTTLFADGVGTTIGPAAFAILAAAVLCLCTGRSGLVYGVGLLRWPVGVFAALIVLDAAQQAKWNHLFPLGGDGMQAWLDTLRINGSMGWPLALLYYEEADVSVRRRVWYAPAAAVLCALLLCLAIPHGTLTIPRTIAEQLLLPGMTLQAGNRVLLMCLWTAGLGLAAVIAAVRAADLTLPQNHAALRWLPWLLLGAYAAAHLPGLERLAEAVGWIAPWMLAPVMLMAAVLAVWAAIRRKR